MRRSDHAALAVLACVAVAACSEIAGLGPFQEVACDDPCDAGSTLGDDSGDSSGDASDDRGDEGGGDDGDANGPIDGDANLDATADADGGADAADALLDAPPPEASPTARSWARWLMPNSAGPPDAGAALPNPAHYDTGTEGLVRDLVTGLTWTESTVSALTLAQAQAACVAPWRLPTRIELVSILDVSRAPLTANPGAFSFPPASLWTSSSTPDGRSWIVSFSTGTVSPPSTPNGTAALCVQGDP